MFAEYCLICVIIMAAYLNLINSASIPLRPTYKPSILLLPPGFDSQKPPLQPLLYPFSVSSPLASPTRSAFKSISRSTADWIPLGFNVRDLPPIVPYSTPSLSSHLIPALEDRISYNEREEVSPSYSDGPVFESIVYGTWKPDPPVQPAIILNKTKQQQKQQHIANGSINSSNKSGFVVDGKVYNKTINRQHGGFIGHIQAKPIKVEKQQLPRYHNEQLSTSSSIESKSKESTEMSSEQKIQRKIKKQGRQKIRPISSSTTQQTVIEKDTNREEEELTTITTTTILTTIKENNPQHLSIIKVNSTDPKLMEVVKQINDSIEIRYNHKQTSSHSNDMMTPATATTTAESAVTNTDNDYDDLYKNSKIGVLKTQSVTESSEFISPEPLPNYEDDAVNSLDIISATRRSWPTDFMDEPLSATDAINTQSDYSDLLSDNNETDPTEISLALSALNIPPSLWPKLPGNITKLGTPYEAKSSAEEPALCVPITVKEQNIVNSKELVFIERVFCFPMPPSTTPLENSGSTSRSTISNNVIKAKVQNFDDYIDSKLRISNVSTSNFKSHLCLVTSILVIYFKFIV
ncbi:uncharacterized protein ACRADG_012005 [Cochliomyia hominivorax]